MGELVSMNQIICEAIKSKRILNLNYGGGARVVEPHCYGVSRSGEELLRAYQTSGHSNSGESSGWKLFTVREISNIQLGAGAFSGSRPLYNGNDPSMEFIYSAL